MGSRVCMTAFLGKQAAPFAMIRQYKLKIRAEAYTPKP